MVYERCWHSPLTDPNIWSVHGYSRQSRCLQSFCAAVAAIVFAGAVLVAPFVDVATLVSTYRLAGTISIISPLTRFPRLFNYLGRFIKDKWLSKDRIAEYVRANEANGEKYHLTLIHAEDATSATGISCDELAEKKLESKKDLGAAGSTMEWRTEMG